MILISSSAYVVNEFQTELGEIPPCFLPLGNKQLIEHQVFQLRDYYPNEKIILSLPESYILSCSESKLLGELDLNYFSVPDEFTLSESISYILNVVDFELETLKLIYGDTLIREFPSLENKDLIGTAFTQDGYKWFIEDHINELPLVWCGYFIFSSKQKLLQCLALNRADFIQAVQMYRSIVPMNIYICEQWLDLGHINTYFRSRALITTQRSFNDLSIKNGILFKSGEPSQTVLAESNWFKSIPTELKIFVPHLIHEATEQSGRVTYALEYLPNLPLNELFVHGKYAPIEWNTIFLRIREFLNISSLSNVDNNLSDVVGKDFIQLVRDKTFSRLSSIKEYNSVNLDTHNFYDGLELPSLKYICNYCIQKVLELKSYPSIMHGDFCFSNILFDSRSNRIKLIDPRGINADGEISIYGDQKYDLPKLTHSIMGLYDHIMAGRYFILGTKTKNVRIDFDIDQRIYEIQKIYLDLILIEDLETEKILPLVILLFVSMVPLHSDRKDRQEAMLLNALRLYKEYCI